MATSKLKNAFNAAPSGEEVKDFCLAAGRGAREDIVAFLDKYPAAIDTVSTAGTTALVCAASGRRPDIVALLLDRGADVNAKCPLSEETALHAATKQARQDIIYLLLDRGADIRAQNGWGQSALTMCVLVHESASTAEMLLGRGAAAEGEIEQLLEKKSHFSVAMQALLSQWPEKEKRRAEEKKARELAADIADYSPALKRDMPAAHPIKAPRRMGPHEKIV